MKKLANRSVRWFGFTRQGVIVGARQVYGSTVMTPARSMVFLVAGTSLIGAGVTLFRRADLGVPPYDVLLSAIDRHTVLSHGQSAWAVSGLIFAIAAMLGCRPKFASLIYTLMAGMMVDASYGIVGDASNAVMQWVFVVAGVISITAGIAVVVYTTDSGGAFEVLTQAAEERGLNGTIFRTSVEVALLVGGSVAGGRYGVATVLFALTIGPLLSAMLQALADHDAGRGLRLAASLEDSEVPTRLLT